MKYIIALIIFCITLIIAVAISGCDKHPLLYKENNCKRVYEIWDVYDLDTNWIKADTVWPWGRNNNVFCGKDTEQFKIDYPLWWFCSEGVLKHIRYVIGDAKTEPVTFKK